MAPIGVPTPEQLTVVDFANRSLELRVLVVGSECPSFLGHLHDSTSERPQHVEPEIPGGPSFLYLALRLGDVRGWKTRVHFYGFGLDVRTTLPMEGFALHADGVVLAGDETAGAAGGSLLQALARRLATREQRPPVAIFGSEALARQWSANEGSTPVSVAPPEPAAVMPIVKALCGAMLTQLKKQA